MGLDNYYNRLNIRELPNNFRYLLGKIKKILGNSQNWEKKSSFGNNSQKITQMQVSNFMVLSSYHYYTTSFN